MTLNIMAIMANNFLKYGHNMATFSMNFAPIFSFIAFLSDIFCKNFKLEKKFYKMFFEKFS